MLFNILTIEIILYWKDLSIFKSITLSLYYYVPSFNVYRIVDLSFHNKGTPLLFTKCYNLQRILLRYKQTVIKYKAVKVSLKISISFNDIALCVHVEDN